MLIRVGLDYRVEINIVLSVCAIAIANSLLPFPADHALLGLIALERPHLFVGLEWAYLALWTSTQFVTFSVRDVRDLHLPRARRADRYDGRCRHIRSSNTDASSSWFSGERHHATAPGRAPAADMADHS